jgi:hypothetical protein
MYALFAIVMAVGGWAWSNVSDRLTATEAKIAITREDLARIETRADERYTSTVSHIARVEKQVDNIHSLIIQQRQR